VSYRPEAVAAGGWQAATTAGYTSPHWGRPGRYCLTVCCCP